MSIQTEIERISGNIAETYAAAGAKGATMPDVLNSDNLPATVASITGGGGAVESVNGMTGAVVLDADDVGAIADEAGAVKTENVADYNITGKKLADQSVTWEKIAPGEITPARVGAAPITLYGTTELTDGESPLADGVIYCMYE